MKKTVSMFYFLVLLSLNFSCNHSDTKSDVSAKSNVENEIDTKFSTKDTLAFSSGIRSIFEDSKGNYWFGSNNEGVSLFDGKKFTYFTEKEGLCNNQIRSIQEDNNGIIWFGTGNGVSSYSNAKITKYNPVINKFSQNEWKKSKNDLWFNANINSGIFRYDGKNLKYLAFPIQYQGSSNDPLLVTGISVVDSNKLWISTYEKAILFDGDSFQIFDERALNITDLKQSLYIRSILSDSKGRVWIGNNGIGVLLRQGDSTINFSSEMNLIPPNSNRTSDSSPPGSLEHVFAILEDKNGNIWFSDRDTGLWRYDGKSIVNYNEKDGVSKGLAFAIYEDKKGKLWIGSEKGSVCVFNGKTFDEKF